MVTMHGNTIDHSGYLGILLRSHAQLDNPAYYWVERVIGEKWIVCSTASQRNRQILIHIQMSARVYKEIMQH